MWRWKLSTRELALGRRTHVMGILNVTPDSFSDGGAFLDPDAALEQAHQLVDAGADILDVGAESTRPGAPEVPAAEEIRRVRPVLRRLARASIPIPISIDTRKAEVARAALDEGVEIVNDVSGLTHDPQLGPVVATSGAGVVLMHIRGTPKTMQNDPRYVDVLSEVTDWLAGAIARAEAAGIDRDRIVCDPGIGFGKRLEDNLALLARPEALAALGRPLLYGASRKSMFGQLLDLPVKERLEATLAATAVASFLGVAIVRVHDVRAAVRAVGVADALREARRAHDPAAAKTSGHALESDERPHQSPAERVTS